MFKLKKDEEAPAKKEMSSGMRKEIESLLAQLQAQQQLSLDDLSKVGGGGGFFDGSVSLGTDHEALKEQIKPELKQLKSEGKSEAEAISRLTILLRQGRPDIDIDAVFGIVDSIWKDL